MKVLSRKPETASGALGPGQLSLDNEDQDEDNDEGKARPLTAEERQLKTQQEREEKQKKYEEARQRLFGVSHASTSKPSGSTTPPRQKANGEVRGSSRTRGTRHLSSSGGGAARQLYDPNYSAKVDATISQKRDETFDASQPIRAPRGPDGSGRGGFGFAPRGGNFLYSFKIKMHHTTIFAIAAYATLAVATPIANPAPEAEANPQLPGLPNLPLPLPNLPLPNLPLPNLPGLPSLPGAPSGAGAGSNPLSSLPVVGNLPLPNLPLPPLPNLPIPPLPNLPGVGSLPLPLPGAGGAGPAGLPNPQDLLGNVTSAIQVLQVLQGVLSGAVPGLPVGVGLGSGNPVVQSLLGLVKPLLGGAGLPVNI
ncbi:MAG: hypothetical protein LQ348_007236 [Seirophora lacunosa]|nr:MAG: hypothetical protein LQ348_007236 [Seirophora lacunosa]